MVLAVLFNRMARGSVVLLFFFFLCAPSSAAEFYTFGVLPRYSPVKMYRMVSPLASYLQRKTGLLLRVRPYSTFDAFFDEARKGKVAISFQDPVVALRLGSQMEPLAVVVGDAHGERTRGMVVVSKGSGIVRLRDLRGKRVAVVSFSSAGGFVSEGISLADAGINPFTYIKPYQAVKNLQENVILDVAMGNAAAGFVEEGVGKDLLERLSLGNSVKVLGYTAWVPRWTICVSRDLPKQLKIDILNALLTLPEKDPALKALGIKGFVPAYKVDFERLASQVERLDGMRGGE